VLAVERKAGRERVLIVVNLSAKPIAYRTSGRGLLGGTKVRGTLRLRSYQAALIELPEEPVRRPSRRG
jgi:hypothetical protein